MAECHRSHLLFLDTRKTTFPSLLCRAGWGYKTRFWPVEVGGLGGRRLSIGLAAGEPPERCSACFFPSGVQAGNGSQTAQPQDRSPEERQLSKPPSRSEASGVLIGWRLHASSGHAPTAAPWALHPERSACWLPWASRALGSFPASVPGGQLFPSPPVEMPPGGTTARAGTNDRVLVMNTYAVLRTRSMSGERGGASP